MLLLFYNKSVLIIFILRIKMIDDLCQLCNLLAHLDVLNINMMVMQHTTDLSSDILIDPVRSKIGERCSHIDINTTNATNEPD